VNCCVAPLAMEALAGVTAMETNTGDVTVRVVVPLMLPEAAWMVVLPVATPAAKPAPLIVATAVFVELQVTELVRFCVLPSLYVPVAVNCWLIPLATDGVTGVTAIEANTGGVTVRVVDPLMPPDVATITLLPVATALARPVALIAATPVLVELQVTELVRFCVLLSLYVPVAVNCWLMPLAIEALAGVTTIETKAAVMVNKVEPLVLP